MADELGDLAATTANDPVVHDAVLALTTDIIQWTREQMKVGTPTTKLTIVRTVLPAVARALNVDNKDEEAAVARAELEGLFADMRGT